MLFRSGPPKTTDAAAVPARQPSCTPEVSHREPDAMTSAALLLEDPPVSASAVSAAIDEESANSDDSEDEDFDVEEESLEPGDRLFSVEDDDEVDIYTDYMNA